jgi:DNA-binding response OmpR family regulator
MAIVMELGRVLRPDVHKFGALWIDFERAEVSRNSVPVHLTGLEFRLLRYFIERAGSLISRDELLRSVWGYGREVSTYTVQVHVHRLRQKLEQDPKQPELIVTVQGKGYRFIAFENHESAPLVRKSA